ncbi:adenylyl cyclase, partial [Pavlovales sp. CCMP2436]
QEMARTDELLHDMMPPSVVAKLREKVQVADELQDVLLLYSDIKGFTDMASKCTPAEVISALQELYTQFDTLVLQYGLFKVQTIGDAYIIMSNEHTDLSEGGGQRGVKDSRRARHQKAQRDAAAMLKMAFAMVRALDTYNGPTPMQMRIGIHYGTVTAGIIGTKKARYDIFGPDTLLGNMIESTGVPGAVCVS